MNEFEVTQADIDSAKHNCSECPLALGLTRHFQKPMKVGAGAYWVVGEESNLISLTKEMYAFRSSFDGNKPIKPTIFALG